MGAVDQTKPPGRSVASFIGASAAVAASGDGPDDAVDEPEPVNTTGIGFIEEPDGGGVSIECSVWAQDCPRGEKCMPWANDGGSVWNATRCSPVDPNPDAVGESCIVEGSGVSGVDSCDTFSMCWDVDPETNEGTCVAFCQGTEANPSCADPATVCTSSNEGVLTLCQPLCNPLADECPAGQGCYGIGDAFVCAPDGSGDGGAVGDPCNSINGCDPGNACVNPEMVPGCTGSGCCSSMCEAGDDSACSEGQSCVAWWDEGAEPHACLEGLGVCGLL